MNRKVPSSSWHSTEMEVDILVLLDMIAESHTIGRCYQWTTWPRMRRCLGFSLAPTHTWLSTKGSQALQPCVYILVWDSVGCPRQRAGDGLYGGACPSHRLFLPSINRSRFCFFAVLFIGGETEAWACTSVILVTPGIWRHRPARHDSIWTAELVD